MLLLLMSGITIEFDREMMHAFRPCVSLIGNLIVYIAFLSFSLFQLETRKHLPMATGFPAGCECVREYYDVHILTLQNYQQERK